MVERALHAVLDGPAATGLPLYRMLQYQLGWVDQEGSPERSAPSSRLYGALCLEAARSVSGSDEDWDQLIGPASAAAELFNHSVIVHEEMQMGDPHADGRASIWWVWGPAQAINVGDSLHAMARLALMGTESAGRASEEMLAAVRILDQTALTFYEGQYLELTFQERIDVQEAQFLSVVETKRGALLGGAMALGAQAAGASETAVAAIERAGRRLGLAAQVHDDVAMVWEVANPQGAAPRMLNKTKLFPVVYAFEQGTLAQKRALGELYFKRVMEPDDVARVRQVLDEVGAREYSEGRALAIAQEARDLLGQTGLSAEAQARWGAITQALAGS